MRSFSWHAAIRGFCSLGLLLAACAPIHSTPEGGPAATADLLVLTGRLIDGTGAAPIADGVVVIDGERIRCAGPRAGCAVPHGARVIDAEGGTIMPGLIDLHAHVRPHYLPLFLAAGVTSVRDANNLFEVLDEMGRDGRERARLFWSGPLIDGEESVLGEMVLRVRTAAAAEAAVDTLAARGVDFIKLYEQLPLEAFRAAARRAREHGLPVAADLGLQVTRGLTASEVDALEAIEAGVVSIEHASGFALAYQRLGGDPTRDPLDPALVDSLARALVANDVVLVPTLGLPHSFASDALPSIEGVPLAVEIPPDMIEWWSALHGSLSPEARARAAADYRLAAALVRRVAQLGGRIGAGTDTPAGPMVLPGGGLHRELELLVSAGLTPLQAIHAATGEAARTLGRPELGVIAPQKVADLLIVDGDPSADIRATRKLRYVIKAGRILSPDSLREHTRAVTFVDQTAAEQTACGLSVSTPQTEGVDSERLDTLVDEARRANSDALVVLKNGKLVGEWYFEKERGPIQTMSATKSIVSMAIGQLLDSGAIESLDQPVADFYPEWRQGRKREITIRQLLNHTSGLQNVPNAGEEIYPAPDAIQLALAAELSHDPGTHFSYNNKAVNLLGGIVERASGRSLDIYVRDALLVPLCIEEGTNWYRDEAGVPHAMAGLELDAVGLATLGQLMLGRGVWKGERLLSEEWVDLSTRPSQEFAPNAGLLWWLHADPTSPGTLRAYSADGYLGQYIVVLPAERIVVVRQKRASDGHTREMSLPGFGDRVVELLGEPGGDRSVPPIS